MLMEPPPLPYHIRTLSRLSQQIKAAVTKLTISEHQVFIQDMGMTPLKTGGRVLPHSHSHYEIQIVVQGNARYLEEDDQIMAPGTICLLGPRIPHAFFALDAPCQILAIEFGVSPNLPVMTSVLRSVNFNVLWKIFLLFDEAAQRTPGWQDRVSGLLSVILSHALILVSCPMESDEPNWPEETEIVEVIDKYFRENLRAPIRLNDVADYVGMSRSAITSLFRRLTGETLMGYLHQLRMAEAHALVVNTTLPLAEIAANVGFSDPAYFSNCFRRFHMYGPQRTRQLLAKGEYLREL